MPKVHIDGECVVECSHIWDERWNGWAQPVFTTAQKAVVVAEIARLGWVDVQDDWHQLSEDEWVTGGWIWLEVEGE